MRDQAGFITEMERYISMVDGALRGYLEEARPEEYAGEVYRAMEYGLFPGGKRLRPLLLLGACLAAGGGADKAVPFACALEMIHSYSLIHDDLPAMDNDDVRRGLPSCHKRFGEAVAILAGDGLLSLAFEVMSRACLTGGRGEAAAMHEIAAASGIGGMVGGQAADMAYENKKADKNALIYIHANKTARLFGAACAAGAALAGVEDESTALYRGAGRKLGMAFQILDDLADAGDEAGKNTYVSVFGEEAARADSRERSNEAVNALRALCGGGFMASLAGYALGQLE